MGRITIFSVEGCPHCKRVKVALSDRRIPFSEISVTKHSEKRQDMLALCDRISTPQVFFNTRHVGGADETIALLETWDREKKKHASPYDRYMTEIGNQFDPSNPRLALPQEAYPIEPETDPERFEEEFSVIFPDGRSATVFETTEMLKKIIRSGDTLQKLKKHKLSFTGKHAVDAFSSTLCIPREKAITFGVQLHEKRLIRSIQEDTGFDDSVRLFRLQCYSTPDILNSYRIWTGRTAPDPFRLLDRLTRMMNEIEVKVTDDRANVDYGKAVQLPLYRLFEEKVCELQVVNLEFMDDQTKTVRFSISCVMVFSLF